MLTIEKLRNWGANVDEGLGRCMNNEAFYLKLVNKAMQDTSSEKLAEAVEAGDLARGFEIAHSIKGVASNLALTPILRPVEEITELLRGKKAADYAPLLKEISEKSSQLKALL